MSDYEFETIINESSDENDLLHKNLNDIIKLDNDEMVIKDERKTRKKRKGLNNLRQPRQKFCPRWEIDFPWLKADRENESIGICTICKKALVCKKSHLERHQKSYKHIRSQTIEDMFKLRDQERALVEKHLSAYLGNDYQDEEILDEYNENMEVTSLHVEPAQEILINRRKENDYKKKHGLSKDKLYTGHCKQYKLPRVIDEENDNCNNYLIAHGDQTGSLPALLSSGSIRASTTSATTAIMPTFMTVTPPQKDSFDLFFEYTSCTVKSLPPKLAAEVKSRVSQLIAEFELRAICEREEVQAAHAQNKIQANSNISASGDSSSKLTTMLSTTNTDNAHNNPLVNNSNDEISQIVYSF